MEKESIIHPIRETKGGSVAERADNDELASDARLGAFGLKYRACGRGNAYVAQDYKR
jgi:hypothetical protein